MIPKINTPLMKNFALMVGGNGSAQFLNLISSTIIFKNSSTETISLIFLMLGLFHIINHFSDLGLNTTFIKIYGQSPENDKKRILTSYVRSKSMIAILVGLSSLIVFTISQLTNLLPSSGQLSFVLFICMLEQLCGTQLNTLKAKQTFKVVSRIRVTTCLIKLVLISIACLIIKDEKLLILAFYSPSLSGLIMAQLNNGNNYDLKLSKSLIFIRESLHTSKWVFMALLCSALISQIDLFMVKALMSDLETSLLVGAQKYSSVLPFISASLMGVLMPHVSRKNKKETYRYLTNLLKVSPVFLLMGLSIIVGAHFVFKHILGGIFIKSFPIFMAYTMAYVIDIFASTLSMVLVQSNNEKTIAFMALGQVILNIGSNYILINSLGPIGAAMSTALLKILALGIFSYTIWKYFKKPQT